MGTWGMLAFDDDGALDWMVDLQEAEDWSVVETALGIAAAADAGTYLEAPDGQLAYAASTVVVAADDPLAVAVPEEVASWLAGHRENQPDLRSLARVALRRVLSERSELQELWSEADPSDGDEWRANVERLIVLLAG